MCCRKSAMPMAAIRSTSRATAFWAWPNFTRLLWTLVKCRRTRRLSLWLKGWVFWTDSNGARVLASNRQVQMISPYLQVRDASGKWVTVIPDMGLPSGTNRTMRVDLTGKFPSADHHVRIVTNLCIYWDQIFFTTDEAPASAPIELALGRGGFALSRLLNPGKRPRAP